MFESKESFFESLFNGDDVNWDLLDNKKKKTQVPVPPPKKSKQTAKKSKQTAKKTKPKNKKALLNRFLMDAAIDLQNNNPAPTPARPAPAPAPAPAPPAPVPETKHQNTIYNIYINKKVAYQLKGTGNMTRFLNKANISAQGLPESIVTRTGLVKQGTSTYNNVKSGLRNLKVKFSNLDGRGAVDAEIRVDDADEIAPTNEYDRYTFHDKDDLVFITALKSNPLGVQNLDSILPTEERAPRQEIKQPPELNTDAMVSPPVKEKKQKKTKKNEAAQSEEDFQKEDFQKAMDQIYETKSPTSSPKTPTKNRAEPIHKTVVRGKPVDPLIQKSIDMMGGENKQQPTSPQQQNNKSINPRQQIFAIKQQRNAIDDKLKVIINRMNELSSSEEKSAYKLKVTPIQQKLTSRYAELGAQEAELQKALGGTAESKDLSAQFAQAAAQPVQSAIPAVTMSDVGNLASNMFKDPTAVVQTLAIIEDENGN